MAALRLVPTSGAAPIDVSSDSALVGRDPTCDVVVSDGSISRKHARLERRGEEWAVVDQGSANGTFVDSQRIVETARTGQELRFGAIPFTVEIKAGGRHRRHDRPERVPEATVISRAARPAAADDALRSRGTAPAAAARSPAPASATHSGAPPALRCPGLCAASPVPPWPRPRSLPRRAARRLLDRPGLLRMSRLVAAFVALIGGPRCSPREAWWKPCARSSPDQGRRHGRAYQR